ncbi:MAG: response regulator, partial [Prevotella sp.]|nr:response regulator [Prevotella sp.]
AENRQISYNFTTFAREYKMYIDRNFVDKMAYNLLSNAFKYTGRKKEITMRLKQEGDRLKMMVEDTGIGITKEKQASLFTRFNQSEFSRDSIGVGLHMVQELVRVHHGEISFEENPVGGSIFTITLPTDQSVYGKSDFLKENEQLVQATDNTQQPSPVTYKEMAMPPMNDHRVLVVDDDDDVREFLNNELRRYFVIDLAYNGEEALEKIKAERPSLVISDVKMPVMNGFELTRKIRQDQELADLPIILLTAISDEEKVVKGTEYGADAYISKPFNIKVLISKCRSLIEQRERLKNRYAKEVVGQAPLSDLIVDDADKKFKDRFEMWIYSHLSNPNMQFMDLADSMKMGRTTFFKKVKQVTGMAPHEYIKKARMEKAAELLSDPTNSISEVAYQTGFDDPNYFSRTFKNYFGVTATQFKKGGKAVSPNGTPPAKES